MPTPTEAHHRLAALAGRWEGDEILYPSPWQPEKKTARGVFDNRVAVDGFFLLNEYTEEQEGRVVMRGHGVYGWDPKRERYSMHWFDSMGMQPSIAYGQWVGDTLTFENEGPFGRNRYVYTIRGAEGFDFRIECSQDGTQWAPMLAGSYRRDRPG